MMISAFCVFRVANRHTFGAIFDRDLVDPGSATATGSMLGDMVVGVPAQLSKPAVYEAPPPDITY